MPRETPDRDTTRRERLTVVGIGNPDRGDDAAGILVARALAGRLPPGATIVESPGDVTDLVTILERSRCAVLIDAAQSEAEPGTVYRFDATKEPLPAEYFRCSTHAFGLGQTIELARTIGLLPRRLFVCGIEGRDFSIGAPLSDGTRAAIDAAASMIHDLVEKLLQEDSG
ncbi:MAG: hydrogenase maturation protease [bacterium]